MPSLTADLEAAARIGADPRGGVSRFAWTPELAAANDWLGERLAELGLEVELDPAGNVLGRWQAGEGKAVLLGSHLDTVPNGGRYDGALGVLAALDVVAPAEGRRRRAAPTALGRLLQRRGGRALPDGDARQPGLLRRLRPGGLGHPRHPRGDGGGRARLRPAPGRARRGRGGRLPGAPHRAGARARARRSRSRRRHGDHGDAGLPRPLPRRGQPCGDDAHGLPPRRARRRGPRRPRAPRRGALPRRHDRERRRHLRRAGRLQRRPGRRRAHDRRPLADRRTASPAWSRSSARRWSGSRPRRSSASSSARRTASSPSRSTPSLQDRLEEAAASRGRDARCACRAGPATTRWCSPTTSRRRCCSSPAAAGSATRPRSSRRPSTASWGRGCWRARCGLSS